MNKIFNLTFLILLVGLTPVFSQADKRIEEIRKIYQETNKKVEECEKQGEYSTTFLLETVVNKNNGSYPAVGIYKSVIKFYYTYGDREKNPYPNRLIKIALTVNRSAATENYEFLFDEAGKLNFYFEKKEGGEYRVYFEAEKPIRILKDEKTLPLNNQTELTKTILSEKKKLAGIFQNSLEF